MNVSYNRTVFALILVGALNLVAGVVFQAITAATYGAGPALDAFFMADAIPGFLNDRLLFGAVNIVLVPLLCSDRLRQMPRESWHIASTFITLLVLFSVAFTAACCFLAPSIVRLTAPGFPPDTAALTVKLLRVLSLTTLFFCTVSWMRGILHAHNIFILPYLGGVVYFVSLSGFVRGGAGALGIWALGIGAVLSSALFCAFHLIPLRRVPVRYRFGLDRRVLSGPLSMFFAYMFLSAGSYISYLVDRYFASRLAGGDIVILSLAQKFEVPITFLVTFSVSLPALTIFSNAAGDEAGFRRGVRDSVRAMSALTIPFLALLLAVRLPLARLWFGHGAFTDPDTAHVASLVGFLWPAFLINAYGAILLNGYFSLRAVKLCLVVIAGDVLLNVLLNRLLVGPLGLRGIALATSLAAVLSNLVLWWGLRRRLGGLGFRGERKESARMVLFCAFFSAGIFLLGAGVRAVWPGGGRGPDPLWDVLISVGAAGVLFPLAGRLFRVPEVEELTRVLLGLAGRFRARTADAGGAW